MTNLDLDLVDVSVRRGATLACDAVTFTVQAGETVALLGPSGGGKTSLLRAIAGLETLSGGVIRFAGTDLAGIAASRRGFGVMFQDLALFPHRDVASNVAYPLRLRKVPSLDREARVGALLANVGLTGKERRAVHELSGGERQRVALARALASEPRLLLLDEPLGSLDRLLRERLAEELRAMLRATGLPAIVVTHDQDEAFVLADRVVLLREGRVVQMGTPADLWRAPADEWVSDFVGNPKAVEAHLREGELSTPWGTVPFDGVEGEARLVVPTAAVTLDPDGVWCGRVRAVRPHRDRMRVEVLGETDSALVVGSDEPVEVGAVVRLGVRPERLILFRR